MTTILPLLLVLAGIVGFEVSAEHRRRAWRRAREQGLEPGPCPDCSGRGFVKHAVCFTCFDPRK